MTADGKETEKRVIKHHHRGCPFCGKTEWLVRFKKQLACRQCLELIAHKATFFPPW